MTAYVTYDADGQILSQGHTNADLSDVSLDTGESILEDDGSDASTQMIDTDTDEITSRPGMGCVVSKTDPEEDEEITISCPVGAAVEVVGPVSDSFVNSDALIEITFGVAGDYELTITSFPYQDTEVEITVSEPAP